MSSSVFILLVSRGNKSLVIPPGTPGTEDPDVCWIKRILKLLMFYSLAKAVYKEYVVFDVI